MKSQEIKITVLEAIITNIKHYLYPELSKNENVDKHIRVFITPKHDDENFVQLCFKYLLDTPRDNEKYKLLVDLYFAAYEYINVNCTKDMIDNLIIFDDKRLVFYIHKSIIEGTSIPIPYFDYLHKFNIINFNLPDNKIIHKYEVDMSKNEYEVNISSDIFEFDMSKNGYTLADLAKDIHNLPVENNLMVNVFYDDNGKITVKQMTTDEASKFSINNKVLSIQQVRDVCGIDPLDTIEAANCIDELNKRLGKELTKYDNEEINKRLGEELKISIDNLIENQNEFNYDVINILKDTNFNEGIVSKEVISYISNIDKYVLVDLTNFTQLKKLASITKNINIIELIKENVTSIIYNVNEDKNMFKYINYRLNMKNILEI